MLDIHSHRDLFSPDVEKSGKTIVSLSVGDGEEACIYIKKENETLFSAGLHPWQVDDRWEELIEQRLRPLLTLPQVLAVGEAGLDRLRGGDMALQQAAFERQVRLSEEFCKPLVIHCVRASDLLLSLHLRLRPQMPWVVHGFRGKPELADQLLRCGFYLSFGAHYQQDSLRLCPSDRLFIETDESRTDIKDLYLQAASLRNLPVETLVQEVRKNFCTVFSRPLNSCIE